MSEQVPLGGGTSFESQSLWTDTRVVPAYVTTASFLWLTLEAVLRSTPFQKLRARVTGFDYARARDRYATESNASVGAGTKTYIQRHGGAVIFTHKLLRVSTVFAFCGLSVYTAFAQDHSGYHETWAPSALAAVSVYASVLAALLVLSPISSSRRIDIHLTVILTTILAVYAYRDLWPLMTFTLRPEDEAEGRKLWAKVVLLTFAAIVEPVLEPYPYIPVDPADPSPNPHPEQTACIASLVLYIFEDPTLFLASRTPHLAFDQLPPLCDYDRLTHLIKRSYPYLDPFSGASKTGHLFWGVARVFLSDLIWQSLIIVAMSFAKLISPIGMNRLLNYIETGGEDAIVQPWGWILVLAVGSISDSLLPQFWFFLSIANFVRTEAIFTSLLFDHALRVRFKADVSEDASPVALAATIVGESKDTMDKQATHSERTTSESEGEETRTSGTTTHSRSDTAASTAASGSTLVASTASHAKVNSSQGKAPTTSTGVSKARDGKKSNNLVGRINNLVTSDMANILLGRTFQWVVLSAPIHLITGMCFLYVILGWSAFVGLLVMILLIPVPAWCATMIQGVQKNAMKATDARVQTVTEVLGVLRMVKLFGWEPKIEGDVAAKREEELRWIYKRKMLGLVTTILNHVLPLVHMVVTYAVFTTVMKRQLTASIVFSSVTGFNMLRTHIAVVMDMTPTLINASVSLSRVADFLRNTELLDSFSSKEGSIGTSSAPQGVVGFASAEFTWAEHIDGISTSSRRPFRLRIEDEVIFKKGAFNLIIGPTGSGKTSILMALLGEMHFIPTGPDSWVNIPREGGVALAVQESWVQSQTIRDNIIFGSTYDEDRYKKVIYQCGLKRDLSLLQAGDATEIGEKGLTLSGGQKARITLARAVYSTAETVLLDDVLAALDVHTARWVVDKCFKGDLLNGRTVLLVTHNIALAGPLADQVVSLGPDGRVHIHSSLSDALVQNSELIEEISHEAEALELDTLEEEESSKLAAPSSENTKGKLVIAEEIALGHVGWSAFTLFIGNMGGKWSVAFWAIYLAGTLASQMADAGEMWWLGWWARQYELHSRGEVSILYYLSIYSLIVLVAVIFFVSCNIIYTFASLRASRVIHQRLLGSLVSSTFRWLDVTPTSRVITRCTQDIQAVDGQLAQTLQQFVEVSISMLTKLGAVVLFTPIFIVPGVIVAVVGGWVGQIFQKAQLPIKREMSNAKSPVLGVFGGTISGLTSIRAYGAQEAVKRDFAFRMDRYVRVSRSCYNIGRWASVRIDFLSTAFSVALAVYLIYGGSKTTPSNIGFSLTMAVSFSNLILFWVWYLNNLEASGNSLERIQDYLNIDHEVGSNEGGSPPAYWPASGDIRVEKLSARYSTDGPEILHDITFHIESGKRIGVVGRTGSGKSSLTLSLLRCIPTTGSVYFDGIATQSLNLDALRSKITIIPQVPELLSGTLRHNLDIFGQYDDATLNDALRAAGLFSLQSNSDDSRLTLDSQISGGGGNISVGQRQIVALARAIVRQSKLLILDEATSAIDYETDTVIQKSLRNELSSDVTVITVAHRLQTIMDYDKIMVLDDGHLVEFDSPATLLKNERSLLRALVDESADKEALHALAG